MVSLTVIVPTITRPTLARTLKSLIRQDWTAADRVLVLADGKNPRAKELVEQMPSFFDYIEVPDGPHNDWSHTPRNWLLLENDRIETTHFCILDDDDEYVPDAVAMMREKVALYPSVPNIFRMDATRYPPIARVLWDDPVLRRGNVGTPMFVVPYVKEKLSKHQTIYAGDFDFINETCSNFGGVEFHKDVTTITRPL